MFMMKQSDREIMRLALPSIVSNITVPLLGLVDLAIVGHLGSERYIAAISVGSTIFNIIYWLMGFLRMGTSGMTSQALGREDYYDVRKLLKRVAPCTHLFQYSYMGSTRHARALQPEWLVYRYADNEDTDGSCYISEYREYRVFTWFCLWPGNENRRCCRRNIGGTVERFLPCHDTSMA